jgi:hypothetical protein
MPDWEAIQQEYEAGGISLRALAAKYAIPLSTLYDRSRKWNRTSPNTEQQKKPNTDQFQLQLVKMEAPSPANAVEAAHLGITILVTYIKQHQKEMDLSDHVKAANALSQYNKIIINAPPDETGEEEEDFSSFTDEELALYAELQERARRRA